MSVMPKPIRFSPQTKLITAGIIVALTILFIQHIEHVLPPFIAAIITAYLFNPLVSWLQRRVKTGRAIWIVVMYVITFLLLYSLFTWIWPIIVQQTSDLARAAPQLANQIADFFADHQELDLGGFVIDLSPLEEQLISLVRDLGTWLSGNVPGLVFSALETVIYILVYLIITFYLLLEAGHLKRWASNLIPAPYREEIGSLGRQIDAVFSAYIRGQLILIVIMSVLLYIPLSILKVPYALVIAVASGVLEILPIIGPWSAAGIAVIATLFQTNIPFGLSHLGLAALVGIIYFTLRQIEDHFIIPNVMGPLVRLHPAVVIFAILAGGALAGAFGLFMSIPVAAIIRIILSYLYRKLTDQPEPPLPPITPSAEGEASAPQQAIQ
ncbi:AI-2E family transporter [Candidatus Oscillochloris fontis]|uniref:AI-2E family transporter n=1 Tax=Candidatus Oscillochloris fontis TaxID=2496868 RepID=UPI00101C3420|nr:AI-2E family transporter [Candidatus Oscillochloris fontis]